MSKLMQQAVVVAVVVCVTVLACRTDGNRAEMQRPTAMAVINLEKVFRSLHEKDQADAALQRVADALEQEIEAQGAVIAELDEEVQVLKAGTDKHRDTLERFQLATLEYQAQREFGRHKIDLEKSLTLQRIYKSIKHSAEVLAIEKGFDMILVDDSVVPVPGGSEMEVQRQISARRMVYTSPTIDLTDELIRRMNQP